MLGKSLSLFVLLLVVMVTAVFGSNLSRLELDSGFRCCFDGAYVSMENEDIRVLEDLGTPWFRHQLTFLPMSGDIDVGMVHFQLNSRLKQSGTTYITRNLSMETFYNDDRLVQVTLPYTLTRDANHEEGSAIPLLATALRGPSIQPALVSKKILRKMARRKDRRRQRRRERRGRKHQGNNTWNEERGENNTRHPTFSILHLARVSNPSSALDAGMSLVPLWRDLQGLEGIQPRSLTERTGHKDKPNAIVLGGAEWEKLSLRKMLQARTLKKEKRKRGDARTGAKKERRKIRKEKEKKRKNKKETVQTVVVVQLPSQQQ